MTELVILVWIASRDRISYLQRRLSRQRCTTPFGKGLFQKGVNKSIEKIPSCLAGLYIWDLLHLKLGLGSLFVRILIYSFLSSFFLCGELSIKQTRIQQGQTQCLCISDQQFIFNCLSTSIEKTQCVHESIGSKFDILTLRIFHSFSTRMLFVNLSCFILFVNKYVKTTGTNTSKVLPSNSTIWVCHIGNCSYRHGNRDRGYHINSYKLNFQWLPIKLNIIISPDSCQSICLA